MNDLPPDELLRVPPDLHVLVDHQVWARRSADGASATVGITALGIHLAGEIYMCRAKRPGTVVAQGQSIAVVELAKAIVSVKSAVSGTVLEVNEALAERPELVHRDPYGAGWLATVSLQDWDADAAMLMHGEPLAEAMRHHAWLHRVEGSNGPAP